MSRRAMIGSGLLLCGVGCLAGSDWPQWRGPGGQGHSAATSLPLHWSETENILWRTAIPGRGWSSPVLLDNQIWMTTAFEVPATAEDIERRLKANRGNTQPLSVVEEVRLHAVCVEKSSGRLLHNIELFREREPQWVHVQNSYASPTPVIEQGRVYCHFGTFGTACVDTSNGQVLWRNNSLRIMHENGPGSSPILWDDLIIFHADGSDKQFIAALHKQTGQLAWRTKRSGTLRDNPQMKKAYGTPLLLEVGGQLQLISPAADWLYAYEPDTGEELWKLSYGAAGFSIVPRPVAGHGLVFLSTCFARPQLLAVRLGPGSHATPAIQWSFRQGVPTISSPLLVEEELYFVNDSGGIVTCLDARTGQEHWRERIGGNHAASPLYADGRIYFCSREGIATVLQPGKTFQVLANNSLEGQIMASPAAVGQALYLRTDQALYRIEEKP